MRDLPPDHWMRNKPLVGCWYQWVGGGAWRQVLPSYGIARSTYNDLGPGWTDFSIFSWNPEETGAKSTK